jgi:TRAP transporter TAXI family solute receptor
MLKQRLTRFLLIFNLVLVILLGSSILISLLPKDQPITLAAGQADGDSYKLAQKIQTVMQQYRPHIPIAVKQTDGTTSNLRLLEGKQVDLAMAQADIPAPPSARIVSLLFPDMYQLIVRAGSGIDSISQLKGKIIAQPPPEGGQIRSLEFLMKHYRLNRFIDYQFKVVANPVHAFCNQEVDAVFNVRAAGNSFVRRLLRDCNGRLVAIDQAEAMKINQPNLEAGEIPKGAYQGEPPIPDTDLSTVFVRRLLLAHKDVDKEVIQEITRVLYEHRQSLLQDTPLATYISPPDVLRGTTGLPIHPGAQAYYEREKPSFLQKYVGILGFYLSLTTLAGSGFLRLKWRLEQARKDKADDYIREVVALMDAEDCFQAIVSFKKAESAQNAWAMEQFHNTLVKKTTKILVEQQKSILAWKNGMISSESLQSFNKTATMVIEALTLLSDTEEFNQIRDKIISNAAAIIRAKRPRKTLWYWLKLVPTIWKPGLRSISQSNALLGEQTKADLNVLFTQAVKMPNQIVAISDLSQLLEVGCNKFRQDLDAIFKRSVNALVEERISQESFQSFRVVWQIALDNGNLLKNISVFVQ